MVQIAKSIAEEPSIWNRWGPSGRGLFDGIGKTWTSMGIPVAGDSIQAFAYCGNGVVVGIAEEGHITRSTDYGKTWKDLGLVAVGAIGTENICHLGNGVLIVTGEDATNGKVYKSTDYGLTWTTTFTMAAGMTWECALCYLGNGVLLASLDNFTLYRSTDYGTTWSIIYTAGGQIRALCYLGNGIVIGFIPGIMLRSTDYGLSWEEITVAGAVSLWRGLIYLGNGVVVMNLSGQSMLRSIDYGKSWQEITHSGTFGLQTNGIIDVGNGVLLAFRAAAVATGTVLISTDYGVTWAERGTTVGAGTQVWGGVHVGNGIIIVGVDATGAVYRSNPVYGDPYDTGQKDVSRIQCTANSTTIAADADYTVLVVSVAATKTITLPRATHWAGRRLIIKNRTTAHDVLITGAASGATTQRIDATVTATQGAVNNADELMSTGTRWAVIKRYR